MDQSGKFSKNSRYSESDSSAVFESDGRETEPNLLMVREGEIRNPRSNNEFDLSATSI